MKKTVPVLVAMLLFAGCSSQNHTNLQCEDLAHKLVGLDSGASHPLSAQIAEVTDIEEVSRTTDEIGTYLECNGNVRWSSGSVSKIEFHIFKDKDGKEYLEYRRQNTQGIYLID